MAIEQSDLVRILAIKGRFSRLDRPSGEKKEKSPEKKRKNFENKGLKGLTEKGMKDKISLLKKRTIDEKNVSGDETKEKERKP